jgi:hypothetical protein
MAINRISTLEVCGESEVTYIPGWTTSDPRLVSLDVENSEEDARLIHNLYVLEELSKNREDNFLKDIEVFRNSFRFRPSSKLFREDTGETIYITGDEGDPVRFLFYTRPEGIQPEMPFREEDILNMERPIPVTEVDRVEMMMHDSYRLLGDLVEQEFQEIKFSLDIIRSNGVNRFHVCPVRYGVRGVRLEDFRLERIEYSTRFRTAVSGYSLEGGFYGRKEEYFKTLREMGRLTSEEGKLEPSSFFLKVKEDREEDLGTTTLRISL